MNGGFIKSSTEYMFRKSSHFDLGCTAIPDTVYKPIRRICPPSLQGWFSFWRPALKFHSKSKNIITSPTTTQNQKGSFHSFLFLTCCPVLTGCSAGRWDLLFAPWHKKGIKSPYVNNYINFAINQKTNKNKCNQHWMYWSCQCSVWLKQFHLETWC